MKTLHKFLGIALIAVCLAFAFVGCTPTNDNPPDHKIDNTDGSKNHDKARLFILGAGLCREKNRISVILQIAHCCGINSLYL